MKVAVIGNGNVGMATFRELQNPKVVKCVLKTLHLIHPYFFQIKGVA